MSIAKILILIGTLIILAGVLIHYADRIPFLGKLPGDLIYQKGHIKVYFPLTTSVLLSILLSIVLYIIHRLRG